MEGEEEWSLTLTEDFMYWQRLNWCLGGGCVLRGQLLLLPKDVQCHSKIGIFPPPPPPPSPAWRSFPLNFLSSGSFHSFFFHHSLEILFLPDHWYSGMFLPSQSPAPSNDFPMLTSILAPICQELSACLVLLFSPLCGSIWSILRIFLFQPHCC